MGVLLFLSWFSISWFFHAKIKETRWAYVRNSGLFLFVLLAIFFGGMMTTRQTVMKVGHHQLGDARTYWSMLDSHLTAELEKTAKSSAHLARHSELSAALSQDAQDVSGLLSRIALEEGMDVCFLVDGTGQVLYTSDQTEYYNLSGRDLSEQPFFGHVERQGWGGGFLTGPEGEPAYLSCHIVNGHPEILAGCLFKLDRLQALMHGSELCVVCDENGTVLFSGEPGLSSSKLWPEAKGDQALLSATPVSGQLVDFKGNTYLAVIGGVAHTSWSSLILHPLDYVEHLGRMGFILTGFLLILVLVLQISVLLAQRGNELVHIRNHQFHEWVEQANSVILRRDRYGRILYINRYGLNLFGYKDKELMGRNVVGSILPAHGSMGQNIRNYLKEIWNHPERFLVYEEENMCRNGNLLRMVWSLRPVRDDQGLVQEFLCIGTDIGFLREDEEHRAKLERQMQHMQKLESLGVLAGGIAHEFNNLLMGIIGNTSLAAAELPESSDLQEAFDDIEHSARRAAELTEQLLAYSGKGQYQVKNVNLSVLIRDMRQLIEVSLARNTTISFALAQELPCVCIDTSQIRQIVVNLIRNAAEAMEGLDGTVFIRTGVRECTRDELKRMILGEECEAGSYVSFEVSDQGHGMQPEVLNHAFEPFFSTRFTGRGLGLSAVMGIVRGHKGAIEIQSQLGAGTVLKVFLPAVSAALEESDKPEDSSYWQGEGLVLVADDEEIVRKLSARMLQRLGFEVLQAKNGAEAVELFGEHARDLKLVVMDVTMPKMNGLEACRKIQRLAPRLPIILSSGYSAEEASPSLNLPEGVVFVHKPYRLQELREAIQKMLT